MVSFTEDNQFVIEIISAKQKEFLLALVSKLYDHLNEDHPSLIRRYYGLYKFIGRSSYNFLPIYFVVYRNEAVV
jgi:hypothetical protein